MRGRDFFEMIASAPPLTDLHPKTGAFLRNYLGAEKAVRFNDRWILNTHFPPYPSRAFDGLAAQFQDTSGRQDLYSVTLAVTNRCPLKCWHCYNADRNQHDVPLKVLREVAAQLQDRGAIMIDLTGGEPLLRRDLEEGISHGVKSPLLTHFPFPAINAHGQTSPHPRASAMGSNLHC